jgi:hypothetical protein
MEALKMTRYEVENLRDSIKSIYNIDKTEYDEHEQELMQQLEFNRITVDDFESKLESYYKELETSNN